MKRITTPLPLLNGPLLGGLLTGLILGLTGLEAQGATDWYWVKAQGKDIGYLKVHSYRTASEAVSPEDATHPAVHIVTEVENLNRLSRMGNDFNVASKTRYVEAAEDGRPISFSYSYHLADTEASRAEGEVHGKTLALTRRQSLTQVSDSTDIQQDRFSFPTGEKVRQVFQRHYEAPQGSQFEYQTLHMALAPQVVETMVTTGPKESLILANGERKLLRRFDVGNPANPSQVVSEWRDTTGKLYKAYAKDQKTELVYAPNASASAPPAQGEVLDLMRNSVVRTDRLIPFPRKVDRAYYRLSWVPAVPPEDRQPLKDLISQDRRQQVTSQHADDLLIRIAPVPPINTLVEFPIVADARYLNPTPYLEADDPEIRSLAKKIIQHEKLAYGAVKKLRTWVYHNIPNKTLDHGFASAKETLNLRAGDCTEHAVLLATLARALGIPSRVAVGLIYMPTSDGEVGSFVYHMWTEVYIGSDGKGDWIALDATNPEPVMDATHIKLLDSDLASSNAPVELSEQVVQLIGRLQINVLEAHAPSSTQITLGPELIEKNTLASPPIPTLDLNQSNIKTMTRQAMQYFRTAKPQENYMETTMDGLVSRGTEWLYQGDFDPALDLIRQAQAQAKTAVAHYYLGERLASLELYPQAQKEFQSALALDPNLEGLIQSWKREILPRDPLQESDQKAYFKALALGKKDPPKALDALQALLKQHPRYAPGFLQLARLQRAAQDPTSAKTSIQQFQRLRPQDPRGAEALATLYADTNAFAEAEQALQTAQTLAAPLTSPPMIVLAQELTGAGWIAKGRALTAKSPKNALGWLWIAKGLARQNRPLEALSAYKESLRRNPRSPEALLGSFEALMKVNDWDGAAEMLPAIRATAGRTAHGKTLLGYYAMRNRQYPQALQTLRQATGAGSAEAYLTLSQVYDRLQEPQKSISILENGVQRVSTEAVSPLQSHLAHHLLKSNPGKAYDLLQAQLRSHPLETSTLLLEAQLRLNQNQLSDAHLALAHVLVMDPYNPEALTLMGDLASVENRPNDALYYYEQALQAFPGHPKASRALALLIDEHQLKREKPRIYLDLTEDEHDYLWQLYRAMVAVDRSLSQAPASPSAEGEEDPYTQKQQGLSRLNQQFDSILPYYRWTQSTKAPTRFQALHYAYAQALYASLGLFSDTQTFFNRLTTIASVENEALEQASQAQQGVGQANAAFQKLNTQVFEALNPMIKAEFNAYAKRARQKTILALKTQPDAVSQPSPVQAPSAIPSNNNKILPDLPQINPNPGSPNPG
jgi:transglutaminase-like putative cysteine protease/tetratricopeptide (TPR) repeat protein